MENNSFEYTYCAERQQEIEAIRKKYLPKEEDKMDQLRRLHSIPTQKAQAASIAIGVLGVLILGTGMSLCMTELAAALGYLAMVIGILTGVLGLIMVALAYPLYNCVLRKERRRIAPEVLRLSEELLK
jgi:hypothetical protein